MRPLALTDHRPYVIGHRLWRYEPWGYRLERREGHFPSGLRQVIGHMPTSQPQYCLQVCRATEFVLLAAVICLFGELAHMSEYACAYECANAHAGRCSITWACGEHFFFGAEERVHVCICISGCVGSSLCGTVLLMPLDLMLWRVV